MLLTKKVKAGVLLYALLMASIFTLLLQFYLHRVVAAERQLQAQTLQSKAMLMAELTKDLAEGQSGSCQFSEGKSSYEKTTEHLQVTVTLNHKTYHYSYLNAQEDDEKDKQSDSDPALDSLPSKDNHDKESPEKQVTQEQEAS